MHWLAGAWVRLLSAAGQSLPLAALISLQTLQNALNVLGYPAVTIFVMIESSGIPFPGETMLLLASFYAAVDHHLQIPIVIACAALGAIVGDNIGYTVGRTGGRAIVLRYGRYVFLKPEHLDRAEKFFEKHGDKTVFFGRFIAVLRAWAAFLAGVNHMRWRTFLIYNAAGGIIWATIFGSLGYFAGRVFHDNFSQVEQLARTLSWGGAIFLVAIVIAIYVILKLRRRYAKLDAANSSTDQSEEQPAPDTTPVVHSYMEIAHTDHAVHSNVQATNKLPEVDAQETVSIEPHEEEVAETTDKQAGQHEEVLADAVAGQEEHLSG